MNSKAEVWLRSLDALDIGVIDGCLLEYFTDGYRLLLTPAFSPLLWVISRSGENARVKSRR
jgi:hypothetical protein